MGDEESLFEVIWSESAIADLDKICSFIAADNPAAAGRVGNGILEHTRLLIRFPFIGPASSSDPAGEVRETPFRRTYRILYSITERTRTVEIVRVWHGARGEPPLPPP